MTNPKILEKAIGEELINWWLWLLVFFVVGVVYYLCFEAGFDYYLGGFFGFFFVSAVSYFFIRSYVFLVILALLSGSFYAKFYDYVFLDFIKIDGKVFVDGVARVLEVKKSSLVLTDLVLEKADFTSDTTKKKLKKKANISKKMIVNSYLNLQDYQEIDRQYLDKDDSYMDANWVKKEEKYYLPKPPKKIIISIRDDCCGVNDVIKFRALIQEKEDDEFLKYNKYHKIGAFGFLVGKVEILKRGEIRGVGQYFLALRSFISDRLDKIDDVDSRSIIKAILIGKRDEIDGCLQDKIRKSGLAHLLAISGLHLSIVAGMFFMLARFVLVRFESFALKFSVKKIAVLAAILASIFYLEISGQAVSVQRAFLMILFGFVAVLIDEKPDLRRMVLLVLLALVLLNPYVLFMVSFQLSFVAVISVILVGEFWQERFRENLTSKFSSYFILVLSTSFLIQILTAPILVKNFGYVSLISILANLVAIPFLSFVIMPVAFLLLFLMSFGFESYLFGVVTKLIHVFLAIVDFASSFKYSSISLPFLFDELLVFVLFFSCLGLFLAKNYFRYFFVFIFSLVFVVGFGAKCFEENDDIIWDKKNKFFALYDAKVGLIFSKKLKDEKLQESLMRKYRTDKIKILGEDEFDSEKFRKINCDKIRCEIEIIEGRKIRRILILLKRNKEGIRDEGYDQIINLNPKYLVHGNVIK